MPLSITVDDHGTEKTERETGMSVGRAITKAFEGSGETLRERDSKNDMVTVNGQPAKYDTILGSDKDDATIEVETYAYNGEGVPRRERPPVGPPQKSDRRRF